MEQFVASGTWWFPDDPKSRFDAKLDFSSPQGATLTPTSLQFTAVFLQRYGKQDGNSLAVGIGIPYQAPILNGFAEGRQFSLLHCQLHSSGGIVGLIIEGIYFNTADAAVFPAYSITYSGLDEWGASGRLEGSIKSYDDGRRSFQATYEMPRPTEEPLRVELEKAFLEISHSVEFLPPYRNRAELTEGTELRILPKKGETISAVDIADTYSNIFRNFLMLATWTYVKPLYVKGWIDATDVTKGQATLFWNGKGIGLPVPQHDNDWLFTMRDLGNRVEPTIQSWERSWELFQPIIRNYFSHRYIPEIFIEVRFLTYMQALEAYAKNKKLSKKLFGLLNSMPGHPLLTKIVGSDLNGFVKRLVDVRDDLTHEAKLNISSVELAQFTAKLELIILVALFRELGFPDAQVEQIAAQNIGFQTRMH